MPSLYTCALFVLRLRRRPGRRAIGPDRRKAYRREPQVHFVWPIEFRLSRDGTLPAGWTLEVFDVVLSLSPSPHRQLHDPYCTARESSPHATWTCDYARAAHVRIGNSTSAPGRPPETGRGDPAPSMRHHTPANTEPTQHRGTSAPVSLEKVRLEKMASAARSTT